MRRWALILLAVAAAFATAPRVEAQTKSPPSAAERQKEIESAFEAGAAAGTRGPATVQLLPRAEAGAAGAQSGATELIAASALGEVVR